MSKQEPSKTIATHTAFVGHRGRNVLVAAGDEWESDHPIVSAHPQFFTTVPGPVRAVETVGEIEDVDPTEPQDPDEVVDEAAGPMTTETAKPIIRRGRPPRKSA